MTRRLAANVSMLWPGLPLVERFAAARDQGFAAVELWWPTEADGPVDALVDAARAAGVDVVLMNLWGGDLAAGERGVMNDPARSGEFLTRVPSGLALARAFGAPRVHALVGLPLAGVPRETQVEHAASVLAETARLAADPGTGGNGAGEPIDVLVEPLTAPDGTVALVGSVGDALELIMRAGAPNLGIEFDVYHLTRMGFDPVAALNACAPWVGHVQYADHPGRGAPGTGSIDFDAIERALDAVGYTGPIGLEHHPDE